MCPCAGGLYRSLSGVSGTWGGQGVGGLIKTPSIQRSLKLEVVPALMLTPALPGPNRTLAVLSYRRRPDVQEGMGYPGENLVRVKRDIRHAIR